MTRLVLLLLLAAGVPATADVVATRPLRTIALAGTDIEGFLVGHPQVTFRMLQAMARRLRNANRSRS